jgi:adenine-specific DNA methylase
MIERDFDIPFIANLALREKQIQQNYRPVIAVHKWFARRPGTLFRGLILSEFASKPLREVFYEGNNFPGLRIADPFMGGGTPLLEANRIGCEVIGYDINPMSYWIVKQEIEHLDLKAYDEAAQRLHRALERDIGRFYRTCCIICGDTDAHVKYFLWVKIKKCIGCGKSFDLFPGYLIAANVRHPKDVFICSSCGELSEVDDRSRPGKCRFCSSELIEAGPARRNHRACPHCGTANSFLSPKSGSPEHRLFAIEYHCTKCKDKHRGRFFKRPHEQDLALFKEAESRLKKMRTKFVPHDEIPKGDETDRLHRWGYKRYSSMFNSRQLLGLELSARLISSVSDERVKNALATNLSDLLRYQNMLCRYDTVALKSLDIFSVHGFPVGLVQCESNFLGIMNTKKNICIGSGGWFNIIEKFRKAKAYCDKPFEVRHDKGLKVIVPIKDEWIGDRLNGAVLRDMEIQCADAAKTDIKEGSLDAVFTDPPYFGNVQYAELMDFCYVWLRRLAGASSPAFSQSSTRNPEELTGNENMGRDLEHFTEGLSKTFQHMAKALKTGHPLVFTYHHNDIRAYIPVAVAMLDAGLTCSASLPCPAEMGASIHISGTGSSIIDTVFVCRSTGAVPRRWLTETSGGVAAIVSADLEELKGGGVKPSPGDIRCVAYGHLIRLAVWSLRKKWDKRRKTGERISVVEQWLERFGGWTAVDKNLNGSKPENSKKEPLMVREKTGVYGGEHAEVSF